MLRRTGILSIPRGVCNGARLRVMSNLGLIEKSDFPGLWKITDYGRSAPTEVIEYGDASALFKINYTPSEDVQRALLAAYAAIDSLMPGSQLLSQTVRSGALDYLCLRPKHYKFLYFAYPAGFPLKHIAWVVNQFEPKQWRSQNVTQARREIGLPALHKRFQSENLQDACEAIADAAPPPCDIELYEELRAEGCSPEEIREFFALPVEGRRVL
jgi:hypothetical protein